MGKPRAQHLPRGQPFAEGLVERFDSPERGLSSDALDVVVDALAKAGIDVRKRKIAWEDGQRLSFPRPWNASMTAIPTSLPSSSRVASFELWRALFRMRTPNESLRNSIGSLTSESTIASESQRREERNRKLGTLDVLTQDPFREDTKCQTDPDVAFAETFNTKSPVSRWSQESVGARCARRFPATGPQMRYFQAQPLKSPAQLAASLALRTAEMTSPLTSARDAEVICLQVPLRPHSFASFVWGRSTIHHPFHQRSICGCQAPRAGPAWTRHSR